jgi:Papain family cysteine protease
VAPRPSTGVWTLGALLVGGLVVTAAGCRGRRDSEERPGPDPNVVPTPQPKSSAPQLVPYVNQILGGGKFIAPQKPPAVTRQVKAEPPLPDLPPLSAHGRAPPPLPAASRGPCGSALVGDIVVPLDCMDANYGHIEHASVPLVPYSILHTNAVPLPRVVDHRLEGTEGPVRNQGASPDCTAFSMAAAVDHAVDRWIGKPSDVSVMQVWARYHDASMVEADSANLEQPLAQDSDWPYSDHTATSWLSAHSCQSWHEQGVVCGKPVDTSRLHQLDGRGVAQITDIAKLDQANDTQAMKIKLAAGQDIWIGLHVGSFLSCSPGRCNLAGKPGARYVQDFDATQQSGHALVISGYATLPHSTYFLLHNSWGTAWGDSGYAWIHEATLRRNIGEGYVIDAHPMDTASSSRLPRQKGHTSCGASLVPDSISAQCVPPCPDGSPRHNAVCPVANQCATGYVNLTGACVLAAPSRSASDPKTGIRWTCGPGGCAYWVPKGVGGCDEAGTCMVSCPAPDFRLGHGRHGLSCME